MLPDLALRSLFAFRADDRLQHSVGLRSCRSPLNWLPEGRRMTGTIAPEPLDKDIDIHSMPDKALYYQYLLEVTTAEAWKQ